MDRLRMLLASCAAAVLLAFSGKAAVNDPPAANPDNYLVSEDVTLFVAVPGTLINDTDLQGDSLTATLLTLPAYGTLNFTNNGAFSYRAQTNFYGTDSFTYRARDGQANSLPTTVTITISPINDAPRATNNTYSADADSTFFVDAPGVLGNDLDVDGDPLNVVLISSPTHGALLLDPDGSFIYTPDEGYAGLDTFTYRASDGQTMSAVATATITVVPAPIVITVSPENQAACVGDLVMFSVDATGTALTYQWFKGNTALSTQTNSSLTLAAVAIADSGAYKVRLIGATNSITNSAILTVGAPVNATALTNQVRVLGQGVTFSTTASGTGPFTYTWLKDDAVISGETGNTLVLADLVESDTATYSVIVNGVCGSVTQSATLSVAACYPSVDVMLVIDRSGSMSGPAYTDARTACTNFVRNMHLISTNGDVLGLVSFNPTATLNQRLTNNTLAMEKAISALGAATNGTCISCGLQTAQDELASSRHRPEALPVIILLSDGLPHDFDTPEEALDTAAQAKSAGTRVLTIGLGSGVDPVLMANMASSPSDYFFANNSSELGAVFDAISAAICRPPTNIFGPSDVSVCTGSSVTFEVQATGCETFNFQWSKDGEPLAGETNNLITLANVSVSDAAVYSVLVSSACRIVTNSATLTVDQPAALTTPIENKVGYLGGNVIFDAGVSGTRLTYEWFFNGVVIGTNSTLTLGNLTDNDAGSYCVVAANAWCGSPVTNCATLMLNRAPVANDDLFLIDED
ncbi:MAG TPA: Ig-like domain-containing protein, partial [Candidatus Limnocylindria bacterium]|nr:Ig-like domain-containing protein [Candidatus Limnocylindria bacterium]